MTLEELMPLAAVVGVVVILIAVVYLFLSGQVSQFFAARLARRFDGLTIRETPAEGDVQLVYHTYCGLLIWFSQTEHVVYGPPDDLRLLLKRLLGWNLTWGMLSAGLVFIPFLSLISYLGQLQALRKQVDGTAIVPPPHASAGPLPDEKPVSLFHRVVGWTAAGVAVLSGVGIIALLVQGELEGAMGGVVIMLLLGGVAKDWLRGRTH